MNVGRIGRFDGDYAFLSNFHPSPVEWDGTIYPTVEHAFQAAKTDNLVWRQRILDASTPGAAKRLGRSVALRPGWEQVKVGVMTSLISRKFAKGTVLAAQLLATGDAELVEGNTWHDNFWGVDLRTPEKGLNWLGKILMGWRENLRHQ